MPSITAKLIAFYIEKSGRKAGFSDPDLVRAKVAERLIRPTSFSPPSRWRDPVDVSVDYSSGWPVYRLAPTDGDVKREGVYVHGGAWINEIVAPQWQLAAEVAVKSKAAVYVPIYPLAPLGTAEPVVDQVSRLVGGIVDRIGSDRTFIMGDSAGGQISLSTALHLLRTRNETLARTILISPALDLRLNNPALDRVEKLDPWLARRGLTAAIEMWRGGLKVDDPKVSPLLADLAGLGPLTLFSGSHDITNPDTDLLAAKAKTSGVQVQYYREEGLIHVYPLLLGPEARRARQQIVETLNSMG